MSSAGFSWLAEQKFFTPNVMAALTTKKNEVLVSHDRVLNPDIVCDERGEFLAPTREALAKGPLAERGFGVPDRY